MGMIVNGNLNGFPARTSSYLDAATTESGNTMGRETFTKLLIAQIQHQDPLEPMGDTQFVAQLAQFSSLEQLTIANQNLEELQIYNDSMNRMQAASLLGKEVQVEGNTFYLSGDSPVEMNYRLQSAAADTKVYIYDGRFELIKIIKVGPQSVGEHSLEWDGKGFRGVQVSPGTYSFIVQSTDLMENPVEVDTFTTGKVTGLSYQQGAITLLLGNLRVPLQNIMQITEEGR